MYTFLVAALSRFRVSFQRSLRTPLCHFDKVRQGYFSRFRVSPQRLEDSKKVSFQRGFARYLLAISSVCAASRNFYDLRLSQVLAQRV